MIAPPLCPAAGFSLLRFVAAAAAARCLLIFFANTSSLSERVVRLGLITGFIALIGVLLSGLAAYRVHDQELTVDGIALARAIDVHASLVQDRLTERELLARVASGLFRSPSVIKANMLQPLRSSIYAFKTDFVVASWIARLRPEELQAAHTELASAGFPNPTIRSFDDAPLDTQSLHQPVDVLMDVEPRNAGDDGFPGPLLRPASDPGADAGAGDDRWKACRVRSAAAVARRWTDRPRSCRAGAAGRRCFSRRAL